MENYQPALSFSQRLSQRIEHIFQPEKQAPYYEEAMALRSTQEAYFRAAEENKKGNTKAATLYQQAAEAFESEAECRQAKFEELAQQEQRVDLLLKRAAHAWSKIAPAPQGNQKLEETSPEASFKKAAEAFERSANSIRNKSDAGDLEEQIGQIYWLQGFDRLNQQKQERLQNQNEATCYQKAAAFREAQIKEIRAHDESKACDQSRKAELAEQAAWAYEQAAYQQLHNYPAAAARWRKRAEEILISP